MTFAFLRNTTAFAAALIGTALVGGTAPASGATITYSDPACESFTIEGSSGNFTLRCVAASPGPVPPGAPTGCVPQISTTPSPLTKEGGTVNLDVSSCSPSTGLTYSWSRNGSAGWKTEKSPSDSLPANTGASGVTFSYQVKVCDGVACTNLLPAAPLTATVPGTGIVVGAISCAAQGFAKTMFYEWNWAERAKFVQTYNDSQGPLGTNGIVVIAFKPTRPQDGNGSVSISEYPANAANPLGVIRAVAISEQPCDLSGATLQYGTRFGYNVSNQFTIEPTALRGVAKLTVGKQYYLNIANRNSSGSRTCTGQCEVRIQASHP